MTLLWVAVGVEAVVIVLFGFVLSSVVGNVIHLGNETNARARQPWSDVLARRIPDDIRVTMPDARAIIVFVSPNCIACKHILTELVRSSKFEQFDDPLWIAAREGGGRDSGDLAVFPDGGTLMAVLGIPVTPFVVAIDNGAVVFASTATEMADVRAAARSVAADRLRG